MFEHGSFAKIATVIYQYKSGGVPLTNCARGAKTIPRPPFTYNRLARTAILDFIPGTGNYIITPEANATRQDPIVALLWCSLANGGFGVPVWPRPELL
jgi:hypothetical protein